MRKRRGSTVTEALDGLFSGIESGSKLRESLAIGYWEQVVGPQAAAATEPDAIRDGILFVRTKSSVWSHELTLLKAHIIKEINKRIGRPVVKEIVFRAQGVKEIIRTEEPAPPTAEMIAAVTLSKEEQAELDRDLAKLSVVSDAGIRTSLQQRMVRDRKLRRWQHEHGWRACTNCTALHLTEDDLCPICRLCR